VILDHTEGVENDATGSYYSSVRICHSRILFVRAYPRKTQKMVFDALLAGNKKKTAKAGATVCMSSETRGYRQGLDQSDLAKYASIQIAANCFPAA
jgi:hypothetical protein